MKITFPCTGCGKRLKARPDAVGRRRKCPVCATSVTCPEPAAAARPAADGPFEAEIVEAEMVPVLAVAKPAPVVPRGGSPPTPARSRDPFADDGNPYGLAGTDPGPETSAEPKKPCPICGETILASAVKCRFCGEILDPKARKGKKKSKKRRKSSGGGMSSEGYRDVGIGAVCMVAGIGLTAASYAAANNPSGGSRYVVFYGLVFYGLARVCRGVYNSVWS